MCNRETTEQVIEDPRISEIAQAFKDADKVEMFDGVRWIRLSTINSLGIGVLGKIRIIKKPKVVLSKYGYDFTADELPLSHIQEDYFVLTSCGRTTSTRLQDADTLNSRIKTRSAFSSKEAAEKWHEMTQAFYDDVLRELR